MKIDEFIARKLFVLNADHPGITVNIATDKFGHALERARKNVDKILIEIDGRPLPASEIEKIKSEIPNVF